MSDQPKEEPAEGVQHINLKVLGSDGNEIAFKIKRTTPLSKLMDAYSNKTGVDPRSVRFLLDGTRLNGTDTPDSLDMEEGDVIQTTINQVGGSC
ncbi:ubiquitin-like protein [Rhizoclosmatium globosum]|uniref:Ubiquitin-like protein n=1 Tax=Rhizoclosmatium globosum TaxID=329046 RepID=A0A1Y2CSK0_9FUNG|nr:ubiquitin-like protein [Rhizoclosmatium globosum]|eukprot:ORY49981.1 ubiquitin-like protein [Rhizoclosmatium globosum]